MVNIILVSKNRLFRQCLKVYLENVKIFQTIDHYCYMEELPLQENLSAIVIVDLASEFHSFQSVNSLLGLHPKTKILVIANNLQMDEYRQLIDSGVNGAVSGEDDVDELIKAIKDIAAGKIYYPYHMLQQIMMKPVAPVKQTTGLTEREIEILLLLCEGLSNEQISARIHLSYDTVKWHRSNILNKCECKNILSLYKYAVKNNLVPLLNAR